jgi:hypothetical protein
MPREMATRLVELVLNDENKMYIVDCNTQRNRDGNRHRTAAYLRVQDTLASEFPAYPRISIERIKSKWTTEQNKTKRKIGQVKK